MQADIFHFDLKIPLENICFEGGGALEHISQKTHCGCVQDEVGWGFEEHGPVDGLPDHSRKVETSRSLRPLRTQTIQWFCFVIFDFNGVTENITAVFLKPSPDTRK